MTDAAIARQSSNIVCSQIRHLVVSSSQLNIEILFEKLSFPALEVLDCTVESIGSVQSHIILTLLQRSSCVLRNFGFTAKHDFHHEELVDLLYNMPSLHFLRLHAKGKFASPPGLLFARLGETLVWAEDGCVKPFLPELLYLSYRSEQSKEKIDWDLVPRIFYWPSSFQQSRRDKARSRRRPLKCMDLRLPLPLCADIHPVTTTRMLNIMKEGIGLSIMDTNEEADFIILSKARFTHR